MLINSHLETFCLRACEAMASGCPVIPANTGDPRRFIVDGFNGFLYPEGDSVSLAGQVRRLIKDPVLRDSVVTHAHEYAIKNWSVARYAQRIASVIESAIGQQPLESFIAEDACKEEEKFSE